MIWPGSETFLKSDPELDQDPKQIVPDPQHWIQLSGGLKILLNMDNLERTQARNCEVIGLSWLF